MFLSTNRFSIVYTFSWEYISISSHIVVCPLFNITSVHQPERNTLNMREIAEQLNREGYVVLPTWIEKLNTEKQNVSYRVKTQNHEHRDTSDPSIKKQMLTREDQ